MDQADEIERIREAVRGFVRDFGAIRWGWDGDCGASRLVELLEDEILEANTQITDPQG